MKIAGRKTQGAWERTNKVLAELNEDDQTQLAVIIKAIPTMQAALTAIKDLANKTGQNPSAFWDTTQAWASSLATGVPYQIYMGTLTFDTYTKVPGKGYKKDHEPAVRVFAIDLRAAYKAFIFGGREVADLYNVASEKEGNPGGIADGKKD